MNFVVTGERRHIDLGTKAKTWHQLVSIIIQNNSTDLMKGLLVLTPFMSGMVMERCVGGLNAVTGSEIDANDHGHLQACSQEVSEVILDGLFEVLEDDDALFLAPFGEGHPIFAFHEGAKIKVAFPDD